MDERIRKEYDEVMAIANRVMEEGRAPTDDERERFRRLKAQLDEKPKDWRTRLGDEIDRFAAALEGMGI